MHDQPALRGATRTPAPAGRHPPATQHASGGPPGNVIPLARQRPVESWQLLKQWADQRGWGSFRCAGAMILAATPEERKRLPAQHTLGGYWRRWLKGETIPGAHMSDPNVRGFYRPIIARMMGTTPRNVWPARSPVRKTGAVQGELKDRDLLPRRSRPRGPATTITPPRDHEVPPRGQSSSWARTRSAAA
jgi:hypothetical protein